MSEIHKEISAYGQKNSFCGHGYLRSPFEWDVTCERCKELIEERAKLLAAREAFIASADLTDWQPITEEHAPIGGEWLVWNGREVRMASFESRKYSYSGNDVWWTGGGSAHGLTDFSHFMAVPEGPKSK